MIKFWARNKEVSAPLANEYRQMCTEILLSWRIRKREKLRWFEGKVSHYGERIECSFADYSQLFVYCGRISCNSVNVAGKADTFM